MPLAASCIQETIRLTTSTLSIRIVEKSFVLPIPASTKGTADHDGFLIPGGSRIVCATRAAHLSDEIWGDDPSAWDGGRFIDRDGEEKEIKTKRAQGMRGFGGGVSIVCCITFCSTKAHVRLV
jgi:cytochrome P450